ncbi:hypothetical protein F4604DRAFT_1687549 [Suillus subluteus]|nr:hypothetical protein F4604DRAFT_1687549 [Suillus subluteus]
MALAAAQNVLNKDHKRWYKANRAESFRERHMTPHRVPNICLGAVGIRTKVRLFPRLYDPDRKDVELTVEEKKGLYEKGFMPVGMLREPDPTDVNIDLCEVYPETLQEPNSMDVDIDLHQAYPGTLQEPDPTDVDIKLNEPYPETLQEPNSMDIDIDFHQAYPGMLQEPDPMDVDIKLNEAHTGTHIMDVDANVNADIDMNEFYLENVEN